jgi:hypothetical protein
MEIPFCPEDWPHYQWFRLVRRGLPLDAEVPASQPSRRAWVAVYPRGDSRYRVCYYEVERDRYEEVRQTWDYDEPGMIVNRQALTVHSEAELKQVLDQWLDDLTKLRDPGVGTAPI